MLLSSMHKRKNQRYETLVTPRFGYSTQQLALQRILEEEVKQQLGKKEKKKRMLKTPFTKQIMQTNSKTGISPIFSTLHASTVQTKRDESAKS